MRDAIAPDFRSIRWHRVNAGLSAERLASRARISRGTLSHLENGRHGSPGSIQRIAQALAVEPAALGTHPPDADPPLDLRALRERRALFVADVADATGVAERVIRRAELGRPIHPSHAKALADFYGCRVTDWLPWDMAA